MKSAARANGKRAAEMARATSETKVRVSVRLDGSGAGRRQTGIPFLDHMLDLLAKHGCLDLTVEASGDIEIDYHHTIEDIGIVLGQAFLKALGDKAGIRRYGSFAVPMDETLARVDLDICGRPFLVYHVDLPARKRIRDFDPQLIEEFLRAFIIHAGITLHVNVPYGKNLHHILEAIFKALGRALDIAVQHDARVRGVPSTKGRLGE